MGTIRTGIVIRKDPSGVTKLYASKLMYSNIDSDKLVEYMASNSNVGKATAFGAVDAFRSLILTFLLNGHNVAIPQLGLFKLSAKSKLQDDVKNATGDAIKRLRVLYYPDRALKQAVKSTKFAGIVQDDTLGE